MSNKKTVLWFGDSPTATTGYGKVAHNILMGLHKLDKYNLVAFGINYHGDPHNLPLKVYPTRSNDVFGRRHFSRIIGVTNPDVIIINNDIWAMDWMMNVIYEMRKNLNKEIPVIAYFPIDGSPIKREWVKFIKNSIDFPIAYTAWASNLIKSVDPEVEVPYLYHGVDTNLYCPDENVKGLIKEQLSKEAGEDIDFIIGYVGRNQPRKRLPELMLAYNEFARRNPGTALYLHTPVIDAGWHLKKVEQSLGLTAGNMFISPNLNPANGVSEDRLAGLYKAFDVLALPTVGEGFGLTLVEGMASGCAILSSANSVIPEVVNDAGVLVEPGTFEVMLNDNELLRPMPSIAGLMKGMEKLYHDKDFLKECQQKGIARAKEIFSTWNLDKWEEIIDKALDYKSEPDALDFDLSVLEDEE